MFGKKRFMAAVCFGFALLSLASGAQAQCDCNGDDVFNVLDALFVQQILAGIREPPSPLGGCDVDNDGAVTSLDALLMAQSLAGIGSSCFASPDPMIVPEASPTDIACLEIPADEARETIRLPDSPPIPAEALAKDA